MKKSYVCKFVLLGCLSAGVVGCASPHGSGTSLSQHRIRLPRWLSRITKGGAKTAQPQPGSKPQSISVDKTVSVEHLLRVADMLEKQGQTERARELYLTILKKDSGNSIARKRLGKPALNMVASGTKTANAPKFPAGMDTDRPSLPGSVKPTTTHSQVADVAKPFPGFREKAAKSADKSSLAKTGSKSKHRFRKNSVTSNPRTTDVKTPNVSPVTQPGTGKTLPGAEVNSLGNVPSLQIIPRSKTGDSSLPKSITGRFNGSVSRNRTEGSVRNGGTGFPVDQNPFAGRSRQRQPAAIDNPSAPLTAMIAGLTSHNADQRAISAFRLGRRGAGSRVAIPHLRRALQNEKSGPVRIRLAEAIVRIDRKNAKAFELLAAGLDSRNKNTRWEACCASETATQGTAAQQLAVVKQLTRLLDDLDPEIRTMAALKLGEFGKTAKSALPQLRQAAQQGDDNLRSAAAASLKVLPHPQEG